MSFIKQLYNLRNKNEFKPGLIGMFTNPSFLSRRALYKSIKVLSPDIKGKVLDVGCGKKPYKQLFECTEYIGIDIDNPGHSHENEDVDVYYDGKNFPFENNSFDSVICNQVLEHVFEPDILLSEIARVLKPNGKVLLTVPFVWDEHEIPNDFGRYTSFGLKYLFNKYNLKESAFHKTCPDIRSVFQLYILYLSSFVLGKNKFLNLIVTAILFSPLNLLAVLFNLISPKNSKFYLDNVILASKSSDNL